MRQRQKEVGERGGRERDEKNQRETENVVGGKSRQLTVSLLAVHGN